MSTDGRATYGERRDRERDYTAAAAGVERALSDLDRASDALQDWLSADGPRRRLDFMRRQLRQLVDELRRP
jgi:hypothetical protein